MSKNSLNNERALVWLPSASLYMCDDGSQIDDENVCDFRTDCPDGEDESTCRE